MPLPYEVNESSGSAKFDKARPTFSTLLVLDHVEANEFCLLPRATLAVDFSADLLPLQYSSVLKDL